MPEFSDLHYKESMAQQVQPVQTMAALVGESIQTKQQRINAAAAMVADEVKRTGKLQMETIRSMWSVLPLDDEAMQELAQVGLQGFVSRELHETDPNAYADPDSGPVKEVRVNVTPHAQELITVTVRVLHEVHYKTGRGSIPLIRFNAKECEQTSDLLIAQAEGLRARADLLRQAGRMLQDSAVEEIKDLPKTMLIQLADSWARL